MSFMNLLSYGYGERSSCLTWGCYIRSRAIATEVVISVFGSVGSLVGTLSGHCLIHQLALQFVFGSMQVPGWYLEWALLDPLGCDCGITVYDLRASAFFKMLSLWLVPWVGSTRLLDLDFRFLILDLIVKDSFMISLRLRLTLSICVIHEYC